MANDTIENVLNDLGIPYDIKGKSYVVPCIYHEERTPSFFIDGNNGVCHCFSCDAAMSFVKFVGLMKNVDYAGAVTYLYTKTKRNSSSGYKGKVSRLDFSNLSVRKVHNKADLPEGGVISPQTISPTRIAYCSNRGITAEEIKKHQIQVVSDTSWIYRMYNKWIYIPIYKDGILRTYFMRETAPGGSGKIYGYYKGTLNGSDELVNIGYERSDILYNQDNCVDYDSPLALSEGIIDSIYVGRVVPQAVATLSNKILKDHEAFISKFKTVYVFPDNDASENGLFLIKTLIPLMAKCDIKVAVLPKQKKDAALCSVQELQEAYDNAAPIREFIVSPRYFRFLELISQKNKKLPLKKELTKTK